MLNLDDLTLQRGSHSSPDDGACVMEAVSFFAGEPWSDRPQCASPVIGAFLRTWNDALPDDERQQLKQYIPLIVNTKGTAAQEEQRSWMALDWLVRVHTPAWLRLAGLTDQAKILERLSEVTAETCPSINATLQAIRSDAAAAGAAAWDAARDAAWAAAWDAARAAARAAAGAELKPTKEQLQGEAHKLVARMIEVTA